MTELALGERLYDGAGTPLGTAGVLVTDGVETNLVLSVGVSFGRHGSVVRGKNAAVGVVDRSLNGVAPRRLSSFIVAVRLHPEIQLDWTDIGGRTHLRPIALSERILGVSVKLSRGEELVAGRVIKNRTLEKLFDPVAKKEVDAFDGFVSAFDTGKRPHYEKGDSGMLVSTNSFSALGLLVAGTPKASIIAPLDQFMNANGLTLLPPSDASRADKFAVRVDLAEEDWNREQPLRLGQVA